MSNISSESKDGALKSNDDDAGVCEVNDMLRNVNTADNKDDAVSVCANCGKGEEEAGNNLKACTACKLVKYCNRDCQIAHRSQHKKSCKKRAAELHDIELFKQPPPNEDCPICMLRLPTLESGRAYFTCCGKEVCCGCIWAVLSRSLKQKNAKREDQLCPFCRTPPSLSQKEEMKRMEVRMNLNDARAIYNLGGQYYIGGRNLRQNRLKAVELWHRAAELGSAEAYYHIATAYKTGELAERDENKAKRYYELAAMRGHSMARYNLGVDEANLGNADRALRHWVIALRDGEYSSLHNIKRLYSEGHATKDDYAKALRSYQAYLDEIKSDKRDEAAASRDGFEYYE